MPCKIINNSGLEIPGFEDMIQSLVSFSQDRFGFEKPPTLFLNSDPANAENMLGKTAYYDPEQREVHIYTTDRHPKDIMRSISHELVHHNQNCQGDLGGDHYSGEGYAQKDPHMRKMEQEAYLQGNMCFRDWEDGYKQKQQVYNEWRTKTMSLKEWKNKELFDLLSQKWGFSKNVITEAKGEKGDADPLDEEELKNAKKSKFKVPDGPGKGDENMGITHDGKMEPNPNPKYENKQLDEDKDAFDKIQALEKKRKTAGLDDAERKELKQLKQYMQMHEQQLDEEEIEEIAAKRFGNEDRDVGRNRMHADRMHEVVKRFKKLIK